jgi:Leucine-rich repeat (LRR) protein
VFGTVTYLDEYPELADEAKLILKNCNGLPLAIVTMGGFLAKQPKTLMEWRKLNEHISAELEMNPELQRIPNVLVKSYDGLPYHLKSCFLYLSIFPEDYTISRKRLVRRWIAEGYPKEVRGQSVMERADMYFMELIDRVMILPLQQSVLSRKKIDSCKVHDLMREISISKSTEENLVFRLEEGCNLNTHGAIRHLTISSNWEGDKAEFESMMGLSRIRSLTVFGKWRPLFLSDKVRLLRVLDLENTKDLMDHHLMQIGKLLHLKYLSIRECDNIFHLPDSLGNLKQLQTLDIKNTRIIKLPNTTINLRKLQYIHAGGKTFDTYEEVVRNLPKLLQNKICLLTILSLFVCALWCSPQIMHDDVANRSDLCSLFWHWHAPLILKELSGYGVILPRGLRKLRGLQTLSGVDIAVGKGILKEIKRLTQLRRLAVSGINKKNCQEFCSTLDDLRCLESLTVHSVVEPGLHGCLDGVSSPPTSLQSLKLAGSLVKLPGWIAGLHNLVKLKLKKTKLSELDATIWVLGKLRNLAILRLLKDSFEGEELGLTFHREAFPSLMVLQLEGVHFESVEFKEGATPKLELLLIGYNSISSISGLSSLPSLKEVVLDDVSRDLRVRDMVQEQLSRNPNNPVFKR